MAPALVWHWLKELSNSMEELLGLSLPGMDKVQPFSSPYPVRKRIGHILDKFIVCCPQDIHFFIINIQKNS
jgi:hypothetical protein